MTVKVDDSQLKRRFNKLIKNTKDAKALKQLGFYVIKTIKHRTRTLGKGVAKPGGNRRTLKKVSLEWAIKRATLSPSSEAASGRASNLTFKGTMLDSMIIRKASQGELFIGFKNSEEEAKAEGNEARGRPFMNLGRVEIRNASQFYKEKILGSV